MPLVAPVENLSGIDPGEHSAKIKTMSLVNKKNPTPYAGRLFMREIVVIEGRAKSTQQIGRLFSMLLLEGVGGGAAGSTPTGWSFSCKKNYRYGALLSLWEVILRW